MNWFKRSKTTVQSHSEMSESILYDEKTFYNSFIEDLLEAKEEVIIESPFITLGRLKTLQPIFEKLISRGVDVIIITKPPSELELAMSEQSEAGIRYFEVLGGQVLMCEGHHRKLAMVDRKILWEGSLNILSQNHSREFMRRIDSERLTQDLFKFLKFDKNEFFRKGF